MINAKDRNVDWFRHGTTKARMRRMPAPYDNFFIGTDPTDGFTEEDAKKFHAIVNVSDTECAYFHPAFPEQFMHWRPVNEMGNWGYGHFWWAKKVLDFHHARGDKVYLHCHAGACRSPTTFIWWLVSRGHSFMDAQRIEWNDDKHFDEVMATRKAEKREGDYCVSQGMVPLPEKLEIMFARMRENPKYAMASQIDGLDRDSEEIYSPRHMRQNRHYRRWKYYYGIKSLFKSLRDRYKFWREDLVRVQHSPGFSTICKREDVERVVREHKENNERYEKIRAEEKLKAFD